MSVFAEVRQIGSLCLALLFLKHVFNDYTLMRRGGEEGNMRNMNVNTHDSTCVVD